MKRYQKMIMIWKAFRDETALNEDIWTGLVFRAYLRETQDLSRYQYIVYKCDDSPEQFQ
jgi:hypothetical protein